jgi:hypothetical protein
MTDVCARVMMLALRRAYAAAFAAVVATLVLAASAAHAAESDACLAALRATVRVRGDRSGTAFAVALPDGPEGDGQVVLVSAAHTFRNVSEPRCTVAFRGPDGVGGWQRREAEVVLRDGEEPRWVRHPTADVAVVACDPPTGIDLAPFPLARLAAAAEFDAGQVRVGQRVRVACFPAQAEGNAAGWPVLRTGAVATFPLVPAAALERFFVDYAHFAGDSGAAVVTDDDSGEFLVAGVVVAMKRQTDRVTSPFEEKTVYTPLGLAIVVPSTLLLETIELWRNRAEQAPASAPAAAAAP